MADNILVMGAGKVVESAPVRSLFDDPSIRTHRASIASIRCYAIKDEFNTIPACTG